MDCPVCKLHDVPDGMNTCPGCGTDLKPLRQMEDVVASLYNDGLQSAKNKNWASAEHSLRAAIMLDSHNSAVRVLYGKVLWKQGKYTDARHEWQKASEIEPNAQDIQQLLTMKASPMVLRPFLSESHFKILASILIIALVTILVISMQTTSTHIRGLELYVQNHSIGNREYQITLETLHATQDNYENLQRESLSYQDAHTHSNDEYLQMVTKGRDDLNRLAADYNEYQKNHLYSNDSYYDLEKSLAREVNKRAILEEIIQQERMPFKKSGTMETRPTKDNEGIPSHSTNERMYESDTFPK